MRKGTLVFLSILAVFAILAVWTTDSQAYSLYIDGCNGCHGNFTSTTVDQHGSTWPGTLHNVHRNSMLSGASTCGACHLGSPSSNNAYTWQSSGTGGLNLGCKGCHGNDYGGTVLGAGLRTHHRNSGADSCGAASCHAGDPTPKPESDKPPYYGLAGVNVLDPLNADGTENWSNDNQGLDNDGNLLYDQNDPAAQVTPFEVSAPAAGESVPTGAPYAVTWTAATGATSYKVKLSIDGGVTWSTIGTGLSGTTTSWNVPTTIKKNITKAIIKVIAYNNTNQKLGVAKSGTFSIDVLTITAPAAGSTVPQNTPYIITWTASGTAAAPDQVIVKYTLNNGKTWKNALGTLGASSFSWDVPAVNKTKSNAKVKVILKAAGVTVAKAVSGKFIVQ